MTAFSIEAIFAQAVRRRITRALVIKDAQAFERLASQLKLALTRAWDEEMRKAIVSTLDRLRDLGPGDFTEADALSIMSALEARVGAEAISAAMREPVINLTDSIFRVGAVEVGASAGIDIAFMRPDLDAIDALTHNNMVWIAESWNTHSEKAFREVLTEFFRDGMTREGLAEAMAERFRTVTTRSHVYWEVLADHTATKVREIGRVTGYQRAGLQQVQIRAHLDERTTPCCRHLHGRVLTVSRLVDQRDAYFEAGKRRDTEAMKRAWVMHGADADYLSSTPTQDLEGVGSPPYHFRCRTITVAYWGSTAPLDQLHQRVTDRADLTAADRGIVLDIAKKAKWLSAKGEKRHWNDHHGNIPTRKMGDYERDARALVSDPASTLLLSARVPHARAGSGQTTLHAIFAKPQRRKGGGAEGYLVTVVDLDAGQILTHHWRDRLTSLNDVTPARVVAEKTTMRRLWQWLIG